MQPALLSGKTTATVMACAAVLSMGGCVDTGPTPKPIDPAYIEKNLLTEPPAQMSNQVNADLGGKVVYLGNDVDKSTVAPGDEVKVVHYWKVVTPPGERWRVFSHLLGKARSDWANIDSTDMRIGHGPDKWQAGQIIRDEHSFRIPKSWSSDYAEVLIGLYPKGGHQVEDRMPVVTGPVDDERRVRALRLSVHRAGAAKPKRPEAYAIRKLDGELVIDGRADEPAWQAAAQSPAFTDAEGGPAVAGQTHARLLWDDQYLYAFVTVQDQDVHSPYKEQDEPMWREDVIELFIDADGNRRGYVELQVNPHNAHFDAWFATTRAGATDTAWNAEMKSAVTVRGTLDDRDDEDQGWDVEVAIPLAAVRGRDDNMKVTLPPAVGDTWRLNVVRIDKPAEAKNPSAAAWNPITYQDFHALDRMLSVAFADSAGNTAPAAAPAQDEPAQARPGTDQTGAAKGETAQGQATQDPAAKTPAATGAAAQDPAAKTPAAQDPAAKDQVKPQE
ncbi:sugar-binding protein [Haliangium sp.]|uniref:carbohydrate-binding family 9-like protein n=1 Tax=Haliangium sp. TaxID=2663208 RepID=UPI003D119E28